MCGVCACKHTWQTTEIDMWLIISPPHASKSAFALIAARMASPSTWRAPAPLTSTRNPNSGVFSGLVSRALLPYREFLLPSGEVPPTFFFLTRRIAVEFRRAAAPAAAGGGGGGTTAGAGAGGVPFGGVAVIGGVGTPPWPTIPCCGR